MANSDHLTQLKRGIIAWNKWRQANPEIKPDLLGADFRWKNLRAVNLGEAHLRGANFFDASLFEANLHGADLSRANLSRATLSTDLRGVNLDEANLRRADLRRADLSWVNLRRADLSNAKLHETILIGVNLTEVKGLDTCHHEGPSHLDFRTLQQSGTLPLAFLRGCGLPDLLIDYVLSQLNQPIQYDSCFISYSSKDEDFTQRLYADLQDKGIRCWLTPEDIQGERKMYEQIGEALQFHEKLLLVLSEHNMNSEWVKTEIAKARQLEIREERKVLVPIRLVDYETIQQWEYFDAHLGKDSAREIREYFIPDFSNWKSNADYQQAFDHLLRDLESRRPLAIELGYETGE